MAFGLGDYRDLYPALEDLRLVEFLSVDLNRNRIGADGLRKTGTGTEVVARTYEPIWRFLPRSGEDAAR